MMDRQSMKCRQCLLVFIAAALLLFGVAILAIAQQAEAATATLTWQDNSTNEDGFHVQRKINACLSPDPWTELAHVAANAVQYVDSTIVEGNQYCFRVNAYNTAGESAWSNTAEASVVYTAASTPGTLAVTAAGVLTWADRTSNESGFVLERKSVACALPGSFASIMTTGPNVVTFTDVGVMQGQTYCYRVAAMNTLSTSPWSNTVERVVPLVVPAVPAQLGVTINP